MWARRACENRGSFVSVKHLARPKTMRTGHCFKEKTSQGSSRQPQNAKKFGHSGVKLEFGFTAPNGQNGQRGS